MKRNRQLQKRTEVFLHNLLTLCLICFIDEPILSSVYTSSSRFWFSYILFAQIYLQNSDDRYCFEESRWRLSSFFLKRSTCVYVQLTAVLLRKLSPAADVCSSKLISNSTTAEIRSGSIETKRRSRFSALVILSCTGCLCFCEYLTSPC